MVCRAAQHATAGKSTSGQGDTPTQRAQHEHDTAQHGLSHSTACHSRQVHPRGQGDTPTQRAQQQSRTASTTPAMTAPAIAPRRVLLLVELVVLPSVLAVESTEAVTVALRSPAPVLPAKSLYVPTQCSAAHGV